MGLEKLTPDQRDVIPTDEQLALSGIAYVPKVIPPWKSIKYMVSSDGAMTVDSHLPREESFQYSGISLAFRGLRRFIRGLNS